MIRLVDFTFYIFDLTVHIFNILSEILYIVISIALFEPKIQSISI
jgi:hypothetical protein